MQAINLKSLHLITPLNFSAGVLLNYYSPVEIHVQDILFVESEDEVNIYRIQVVNNSEQRKEIIIGGSTGNPITAKYLTRLYLKEVKASHRDYPKIHDKVCDALGIPY